jgi:hypothetical protein
VLRLYQFPREENSPSPSGPGGSQTARKPAREKRGPPLSSTIQISRRGGQGIIETQDRNSPGRLGGDPFSV